MVEESRQRDRGINCGLGRYNHKQLMKIKKKAKIRQLRKKIDEVVMIAKNRQDAP